MKLNREFFGYRLRRRRFYALRRKLSQQVGWKIQQSPKAIVLCATLNSHERSEFTSIFLTSIFTSES